MFKKNVIVIMMCFCTIHTLGQTTGDYQSFSSGNWSAPATWSRWNGASWINPAPASPTSADGVITILNGHSVTINASVTVDQVDIATGGIIIYSSGTLSLANGLGDDLVVENGGLFRETFSTAINFSFPTTFRVKGGGILEGQNNTNINYAIDATHKFIYDSASIFNCNAAAGSLNFFNNTYFPDATTAIIPVLRITKYSSINMSSNGNPTTINGIFEFNHTATLSTIGTGSFIFRNGITGTGSITQTGTGPFQITGSLAYLGGTGVLKINSTGLSVTSTADVVMISDKVINNTTAGNTVTVDGIYECSAYVLSGSAAFTLSSGAWIKIGSFDGIWLVGNSRGNIQTTGTRTYNQGASYEYYGAVAQISGNGLPQIVKNLKINNSAYETVTLSNYVAVDDVFYLNKGFLSSSIPNILTLRDTTAISSPASNYNTCCSISNIGYEKSFVVGGVRSEIKSSTQRWFPVGKISGADTVFAPIAVTPNYQSDISDTAEYFHVRYADTSAEHPPIDHVSLVEYWKINSDVTTTAAHANITLSWRPISKVGDGNSADDVAAMNSLVVAHYIDDDAGGPEPFLWNIEGGDNTIMPKASGSTVSYGTVTTNVFNLPITAPATTPYFTLGTKGPFNVLPVRLLQFAATKNTTSVHLNWLTSEEDHVDVYEVEKSVDGNNFSRIAKVFSENYFAQHNYFANDIQPAAGINYYRLKVTDKSGKISYSKVIKVRYEKKPLHIIYTSSSTITLQHEIPSGNAMIKIFSSNGALILKKNVIVGSNQTMINISSLQNGLFIVAFSANNHVQTIKFIKP